LDFEEIESDLSDTFDDILVILKSPVQAEISKRASQLLSHSIFDDGITPGVFGPQLELLDTNRRLHHRPRPALKVRSGKSCKVGRAFRGPCLRQLNSHVGVNGIISGAAMQDVGDYGFSHGKLCAEQSGGKYQNTQYVQISICCLEF